MPQPIKPIHQMNAHAELFESAEDFSPQGLSEMQIALMGENRTAGRKFPENIVSMLDMIYKSEDELINIATAIASTRRPEEKVYRVPSAISDYDLLGLKAQGLIGGGGRAVTFTESGKVALRDKWLKSANDFAGKRTKSQYIHPANKTADTCERSASSSPMHASSVKNAESGKFKRVSSVDQNS